MATAYDDDRDDRSGCDDADENSENKCGFFDLRWAMTPDHESDHGNRGPDRDGPLVDRCGACGVFVATESAVALRRKMNGHELDEHGETFPDRSIEAKPDYR